MSSPGSCTEAPTPAMCLLAPLPPVPQMLCVLLLLGGFQSLQQAGAAPPSASTWDNPTCSQDPVTVAWGQRAVMTCHISNNFTRVRIRRLGAQELLFDAVAPSNISNGGWRLLVWGSEAQLQVAQAQPAQAGTYMWALRGKQWEQRNTSLHVTEHQETPSPEAKLSVVPSAEPLRAVPEARTQSTVPWSLGFIVLCGLVLLCAVKCRRRRWTQLPSSNSTGDQQEQERDHVQPASDPQL